MDPKRDVKTMRQPVSSSTTWKLRPYQLGEGVALTRPTSPVGWDQMSDASGGSRRRITDSVVRWTEATVGMPRRSYR